MNSQKYYISSYSSVGKKHEQQDSFIVICNDEIITLNNEYLCELEIGINDFILCAVADGASFSENAKLASQIVVNKVYDLRHYFVTLIRSMIYDVENVSSEEMDITDKYYDDFIDLMMKLNSQLLDENQDIIGSTTLNLVYLDFSGNMFSINVGDSITCMFNNKYIKKMSLISQIHSLSESRRIEKTKNKKSNIFNNLFNKTVLNYNDSHIILRYLGVNEVEIYKIKPYIHLDFLEKNYGILISTDGLFESCKIENRIKKAFNKKPNAREISNFYKNKSNDNISLICIKKLT